jgi:hypothetical protein
MVKRLLLVLIISCFYLGGYAQDKPEEPKLSIIDGRYAQPFMELLTEFQNYGIDITPLHNMGFITVVEDMSAFWAIVAPNNMGIYINSKIPSYLPSFKKFVLLHELNHFFIGPGHVLDKRGPKILWIGTDINVEHVIINYCEYEQEYLEFLSDLQKK